MERSLTTAEVARHFGVPRWRITRLFERGFLPPAERVGRVRALAPGDLPDVKAALEKAGYIPPESIAS